MKTSSVSSLISLTLVFCELPGLGDDMDWLTEFGGELFKLIITSTSGDGGDLLELGGKSAHGSTPDG